MIQRITDNRGNETLYFGKLTLISTENMSRTEWLQYRDSGLGGSDMGTILGYNKYMSATELYYQKVGLHNSSTEENEAMFWGTELEDQLRDKGQYLNLEDQSYIENKRAGNKLRRISKFKYMVRNDDYPWLLANIDGLINFSPRWWRADGIAECKTISRQAAEMWETIPVYHLFQTNHYITVVEPMLRELVSIIFYLQEGQKFSGWRIPVVPHLRDEMLDVTQKFWENVQIGRGIVSTEHDIDKQLKYLSEFEPAVEDTPKYYEFLSELYKRKQQFVTVAAGEQDYQSALLYRDFSSQIKALEAKRQLEKNKIMKSMKDNGANIITLPNGGKITFNKKLYINTGNDEEEN